MAREDVQVMIPTFWQVSVGHADGAPIRPGVGGQAPPEKVRVIWIGVVGVTLNVC